MKEAFATFIREGCLLPGKSAHGNGGKIPYYEHAWAVKRQACLTKQFFDHFPTRVLAAKLEPEVWDKVLQLFNDPERAQSIVEEARKVHESKSRFHEADRLRKKIRGVEDQIGALAEHLSQIPKGVSPAPIFAQMQRLEDLKGKSQAELDEMMKNGCGADIH